MSGIMQVVGCRHAETIPTLGQPASEKRQGRKSRGVGTDSAVGARGFGVGVSVGEVEPMLAIGSL
jgi:hypothetical protein